MESMIIKTLHQLGLNQTEIKVYLMLLQTGTTPASTIGKRIDIPPSTARYTCKQLVQMGIVMMGVKGNTLLFTAREPEHLSILLEKDRNILKRKQEGLNKIVGDLKKLYNPHSTLPKVRFCEGVEGLIGLLEDALRSKKTIYSALRLNNQVHPDVWHYLTKEYVPRQIKKSQHKAYCLFSDNDKTKAYSKQDREIGRITLLVPEKDFPFAQCMQIYDDKVAFYYSQGVDTGGIILQNEKVRDTQLALFKMAWQFAKTLKQNQGHKIPPLV